MTERSHVFTINGGKHSLNEEGTIILDVPDMAVEEDSLFTCKYVLVLQIERQV